MLGCRKSLEVEFLRCNMAFVADSEGDKLMQQMRKDVATSRSARVIIPVLHNYLEHVLERLVREKITVGNEILGNNSSLISKAQILYALKLLNKDQYDELCIINTIRNKFVHKFDPNLKDILKLSLTLKFHPYNKNRSPIDMVTESGIQLMSQLIEGLERDDQKESE